MPKEATRQFLYQFFLFVYYVLISVATTIFYKTLFKVAKLCFKARQASEERTTNEN